MYLDYFGLNREPFTIAPDPAFLYPSPQHRQALAHLKYGLEREGGFILLTGEVGTGKTTLTRLLLEQLAGNIRAAYVLNAKLSTLDVMASICQELGIEHQDGSSIKALIDLINQDLLSAHSRGLKTLLVIEEAQNLDPDVLEMLRLLTNLETNTTKLLHILLVGQPELLELISRNELRQLNQRVVSRFHLSPLNHADTINYLQHRMRRAGTDINPFAPAAMRELHRLSGGVPRVLNLLAERALLGAYATGVNVGSGANIGSSMVKTAAVEVFGDTLKNRNVNSSKPWLMAFFGLAAIVVLIVLFYRNPFIDEDRIHTDVETQTGPDPEYQVSNAQTQPVFATDDVPNPAFIEDPDSANRELAESDLAEGELGGAGLKDVPGSPLSKVPLNAFEALLQLWGRLAVIPNQQELCSRALESQLHCLEEVDMEVYELEEINRPGLITFSIAADGTRILLLERIESGEYHLSSSAGSVRLSEEQFLNGWGRDFLYLWPAPTEYQSLLYTGDTNPGLVDWLQTRLGQLNADYQPVISGGLYSRYIAGHVAAFQESEGLDADAVVGPRTLLRLMDYSQSLPRLTGAHTTGAARGESKD